jgi:hypothetical protein
MTKFDYVEGVNLNAMLHNLNKLANITPIGNPFTNTDGNLCQLYSNEVKIGGKSRARKGYKKYMKKTRKRN